MEILKQKSERMWRGHIYQKDNFGGLVENVLELEKTGGEKTTHYPHICSRQSRAILDFSLSFTFLIQPISKLC